MKNPFKQNKLDRVIEGIQDEMLKLGPTSDKYHDMAKCLVEILEAKAAIKKGVSWDTVLIVGGNLFGLFLVLKHEKLEIITSKAFGMLLKGRV